MVCWISFLLILNFSTFFLVMSCAALTLGVSYVGLLQNILVVTFSGFQKSIEQGVVVNLIVNYGIHIVNISGTKTII